MFAIKLSRVFLVEASTPKNCARMSLSIPTICAPSWLNRLTVSEPINPADPVTIIVRISLGDDKIDNHSRWLAKNPGYIARARIHSRGGIFRIAFEHAVNQLFLFCRVH